MDKKAKLESELGYIKDLPGFTRSDPQYFKDPMIDKLLHIVLLLGGEFWTLRDRLMIHEHLLATHGRVTPDLIETFKADEAFTNNSAQQRKQFIRQVFGGLYPQGEERKKDHFAWLTDPPKA